MKVACALLITTVFGSAAVVGSGADAQPTTDAQLGSAVRLDREGPAPDFWAAASTTDNKCWRYKESERAFARKMNGARVAIGKGKLSIDPELSKAARRHTREMVEQNLLHHTTSDGLRRRVTHWNTLGENVGVGGTVDSLHVAFMNSPAHKENILFPTFKHVGVGVTKTSDRMWVTVIFEAVDDPGTPLPMPKC